MSVEGREETACCVAGNVRPYRCLYRIKASFSRDISLQPVEVQRSTTWKRLIPVTHGGAY